MVWVVVKNKSEAKKPRSKLMRNIGLCFITFGLIGLTGCTSHKKLNKYGVKTSKRVYASKGKLTKKVGVYKVGKPYKVAGKWYYPREDKKYNKTGKASWYGDEFHGRKTANGEIFDMHALTAAHKTLPLPSLVKVTNLANGKSIIVRVNDRGPYHGGRIIDLSRAAADALDYRNKGVTNVRVQYMGRAAAHPKGDNAKIAALGGKVNGASGKKRNLVDHMFGWNKPSSTPVAKSANGLNAGDMQEFDPDIQNAVASGGSSASAKSIKKPKNQGKMLSLASHQSMENIDGGKFIQVAMFSSIKQAIEYKRQLGDEVYSKIDIRKSGSNTMYAVMVQA